MAFVYMVTEDAYVLPGGDVVRKMKDKFENELRKGKIKSYMVLYHSQFDDNANHILAKKEGEFKAISLSYHFKGSDKAKTELSYIFENGSIIYKGFTEFYHEENNETMNTRLINGKVSYSPNTGQLHKCLN